MADFLLKAMASGVEGLLAWADLLDRINVFPVPDGDTGRNLVITLSPLKRAEAVQDVAQELLLAARGNSGNIAARFFSGFLNCPELSAFAEYASRGRDLAYLAVAEPRPGTMLTFFDQLTDVLEVHSPDPDGRWLEPVIDALAEAVRSTRAQVPELEAAGVVDAGALGMFIFFDAYFQALAGRPQTLTPVVETFQGALDPVGTWWDEDDHRYCLDVVVHVGHKSAAAISQVGTLGHSVVALSEGEYLKVHLHAAEEAEVRTNLASLGEIVRWAVDDLGQQTKTFVRSKKKQLIHVMTDGAGSVTRADAAELGMTLLDSYLNIGQVSLPETYVDPDQLFMSMNRGEKVSTAQASNALRWQCYRKVVDLHPRVLYIAVGSIYTGNVKAAMDWRTANDMGDRLVVLDSGSASGRLGLAAIMTARRAQEATTAEEVIDFARRAVQECQEYIFLEKLQYLARGGRLSKTSAFFGDMLKMKPVISPRSTGAEKVAVVRGQEDQVHLAFRFLDEADLRDYQVTIMLEYTDNQAWLRSKIEPEVARRFQRAEIILRPMSLTSAAHMGPGTWGVAFLRGER